MMEFLHFCFKDAKSGVTAIIVLCIILAGLREICRAIFRRR